MATQSNLDSFMGLAKAMDEDLTSDASLAVMAAAVHDDVEYVQPDSLPHGGTHIGREGWITMQRTMRANWDLNVTVDGAWDLADDDVVILYIGMEFTARSTGRIAKFPALELLKYRDGRLARVEIFLQDTQALLDTLDPA